MEKIKQKTKQVRKRVWKYFWEQKWEEVIDWSGIILFMFLSTGFVLQMFWIPSETSGEPIWATGAIIGLCIIGFWVFIGLILLIRRIVKWLKSNWQEAKKKAEGDFKKN